MHYWEIQCSFHLLCRTDKSHWPYHLVHLLETRRYQAYPEVVDRLFRLMYTGRSEGTWLWVLEHCSLKIEKIVTHYELFRLVSGLHISYGKRYAIKGIKVILKLGGRSQCRGTILAGYLCEHTRIRERSPAWVQGLSLLLGH